MESDEGLTDERTGLISYSLVLVLTEQMMMNLEEFQDFTDFTKGVFWWVRFSLQTADEYQDLLDDPDDWGFGTQDL